MNQYKMLIFAYISDWSDWRVNI